MKVVRISKALAAEESRGESVGLLKFESWSIEPLFREVRAALALGGENQWAPAAAQRFARYWPVGGVDIAGPPWIEIDFPEDLRAARTEVWPVIRRASAAHQHTPLAVLPALTGVAS